MDFLLASLLLIVSLVILNYLLINYSRNNYYKYLNSDTNTTKIITKNSDSHLELEDKIYITCNGLLSKPLALIKSRITNFRTPLSKKINLFLDKIAYSYNFSINKIDSITNSQKQQSSKAATATATDHQSEFDEILDDNQQENTITHHEQTEEEILTEKQQNKSENLINYEKIENELITRMDKESRDQKFMTALELGDIYGKMGNREEQKEMYLWVLENSADKSKDMARDRIIAL